MFSETTEETRRCYSCKETKPLEKFVSDSNRRLGHTFRCLVCARMRYKTPEARARGAALKRELRAIPEQRARIAETERRYAQANRVKKLAAVTVYRAVKDGRLRRSPCEVCGSPDVHAHHDDYAERLSVRWLCSIHHKAWHMKNGEGANAHG